MLKRDEDFEEEKNEVKGLFLKSFFEKDPKDLLDFMKEKYIDIPQEIQEFYVESKKKDEQTLEEFGKIFSMMCAFMEKNKL